MEISPNLGQGHGAFHFPIFNAAMGFMIWFSLGAVVVRAQLSPGPLSKPHAHLEGIRNCSKCHGTNKQRQVDENGCNACHTLIQEQLKTREGLHGRGQYSDCSQCHPEHVSRTFKILNWRSEGGVKNFDHHKKTGYPIKGAHKKQECRDCHNAEFIKDSRVKNAHKQLNLKTTYLGLSQECLSCHKDEHGKGYAKTCADCHNMKKWKPAPKFNHDTMTDYKLKGRHRKLKCADCHKREMPWRLPKRLRVTGTSCTNCHEDTHKGKYNRRCISCHTESGWKNIKKSGFDHDKTGYPLTGRHAGLQCKECHTQKGKWLVAEFEKCADCHQDGHPNQIKYTGVYKGCEDCHTTKGFSPSEYTEVEHARTDFKLDGAHLASACTDCHKPLARLRKQPKHICKRQFTFDLTGCSECHGNPHVKGLNPELDKIGCEYCHVAAGWDSISYNHNNSGWPLQGRHKDLDCIKCHMPKKSRVAPIKPWLPQFGPTKNFCADCHKDEHQGQFDVVTMIGYNKAGKPDPFNSGCASCHTSVDWLAEKFDHNRHAAFKLEGAHMGVSCDKCHPQEGIKGIWTARYRPLKHDCRDCHGETADSLDLKIKRGM